MPVSIVFGANGYIGRHLVNRLINLGHKVIPVGRNQKSIDNLDNYIQVDITSFNEVSNINFDVDYIFNFASKTGTADGFEYYENYIDINVTGHLNLLKHIASTKSNAKVIFPSSRLVYKGQKDTFIKEEDEKEAKTVYAQTKLSCENYLEMFANFYGIKYSVFRICVPYGNNFSSDYSYGTIGFFLSKAKENNNITLFGKGELKRTFTHINDICTIITETSFNKNSDNEIYNIGSNDNMSLDDVATIIAKKYGVNIDCIDWPKQALMLESGDTMFDDKKVKKLLNYNYQNNLSDWVEKL